MANEFATDYMIGTENVGVFLDALTQLEEKLGPHTDEITRRQLADIRDQAKTWQYHMRETKRLTHHLMTHLGWETTNEKE